MPDARIHQLTMISAPLLCSSDTPSTPTTVPPCASPDEGPDMSDTSPFPKTPPRNAQTPIWQTVLEALPLGIAVIDGNSGQTLWTNAALRTLVEAASGIDDVVRLCPYEYLPNFEQETWEALRLRTLASSSCRDTQRESGRLRFVHHATRNIAYWDWSLESLPEADEAYNQLFLTVQNTTEIVMNERQLATAVRAAQQATRDKAELLAAVRATQTQMVQMEKMRAVGELAQGVAHDINNALMAVLGYSELVMEELDDPKALASHVEMISKAAMDASSTVQRLNKFARRGVTTHGDLTDLNEIVRDVVQMTRPRWRDAAQREGHAYQVDTDLQPLPPILGEPSGLREVLINMIHNALNAMPQGGTLKLSTRPYGDNEVEIEVADNGIGMTPQVKSRIFDPFFTTRGVEGTGLGLSVSWSIVQRHGGTIHVDSAPNRGTHFFIRLPVSRQEGPILSAAPIAPLPPRALGIPILVVEDEPIVGGVLSSILSRHGYHVTLVGDAKTGLQKLNAPDADFQIVLTDHGMPGMNGLQMIAESKRIHPNLPILLLTGWGETVLETNVVEARPDAVLGKPINQSDLLEAIARILNDAAKPTPFINFEQGKQ